MINIFLNEETSYSFLLMVSIVCGFISILFIVFSCRVKCCSQKCKFLGLQKGELALLCHYVYIS